MWTFEHVLPLKPEYLDKCWPFLISRLEKTDSELFLLFVKPESFNNQSILYNFLEN